jgi:TolB-like protein/DNA-binding winged helix-turn-helix (wHTH) protein
MIYAIGSCLIDTGRFEIRRDGESLAVEPQVFDLLVLLIENRDRIVTKDEIIDKVWKGRIVSDAAISSRIKAARHAVGDDGKAQSLIRTIHRRGLRFVGEVAIEAGMTRSGAVALVEQFPYVTPRPARMSRREMSVPQQSDAGRSVDDNVAGLDLSLPKQPSIVVLPFHTLSSDADGRLISDGMTLDIMTRLARTRWLFVISRGTAFMFRGPSHDARSISRKLGVRYIVQGNIHLMGKRIRIRAALIDAVAGCEAWADQFDCDIDDIFRIQDDIASHIVSAVETEIEQTERRRALLTHPSSLDAWSAYHRGAWHMYQFTPEGYDEAERFLKFAAKLDPSAPRVFAGLSFVHWQRAFLEIGNDREGDIQQAFDYARHALLLDPREPQGYWALGRASLLRHDLDQAVEEIGRSVKLNPNFAIGHYSVAFACMLKADSPESDLNVRQARRLSPYDLMSFAMLAVQAFNATCLGRLDEGATLANRAVRQPNAHYHILAIAAFCNAAAGRGDISRGYLARLKRAHPGYRIADYFRAFPYQDPALVKRVRDTFIRLGLEE